jgi:acyl-CoA synthetase (AMP-forming)/AMP-acid ligase II
MLYQQWTKTVAARRNDLALHDLASDRKWTFAQLFAAAESRPSDPGKIICPQGHSPEFILSLLSAWGSGQIVCPLEPGQTLPDLTSLPKPCAHLKWTSGTTDAARLIAFTAEQLAADAAQIVAVMGLRPDWPNLGVISMAHSYGFSNLVLPLLLHGIPLILVPDPLPETVRRTAAQQAAVTLAAVPALWRAWHEAAGIPPQVRLAISAGAPLPLKLEQAVFALKSVKIHNFYGASECGAIAYDSAPEPRPDASLAGAVMPGVSVSVNTDGCLMVGGPAVGQSYWPVESASLCAGQFQSSDLAELKNGLIFLRGRCSDQINVAGRKVSPETIERALLLHPLVRECLVFGVPSRDSVRTETIVAMVAASAGESELRRFLLDALPSWQVPRLWQMVDSLPTGPRGKISRAECRAKFSN